jgi:hypothetical protein
MLNKPSVAILVDCWDSGLRGRDIFHNIIQFLEQNKFIEYIVLASYECVLDDPTKIWYTNYYKEFWALTQDEKLKEMFVLRKKLEKELPKELFKYTEPSILNFMDKSKVQISLTSLEEFEYYLSIHPDIKNVFVLGEAWDGCVRDRPLGYKSLTKIQNVSILTKNDCVKTIDGIFPDMSLESDWEEVSDGIYILGNKVQKSC